MPAYNRQFGTSGRKRDGERSEKIWKLIKFSINRSERGIKQEKMGLFDFLKKKKIDETVNQSSKIEETAKQTMQFDENSRNVNEFYMEVINKYTAFGKLFIEGKGVKSGHQLSVGDKVYVYDEKGGLKYEMIDVSELQLNNRKAQTITECNDYITIVLNGLLNIGDIDKRDIISMKKLKFENAVQDEQPAVKKILPDAKTYNHADRRTHVNMATNDLAGMLSLASNREWVRNVGQDLYNAHGFDAMQEVFINVKNRRPDKQIELSQIWDGVGGWAD